MSFYEGQLLQADTDMHSIYRQNTNLMIKNRT